MSEEESFTPWTADGAARLSAAAREVAQRIEAHAAALAALGPGDIPDVFAANDLLGEALVAYADAQFNYCGNSGPLGLVLWEADAEGEADDEPASVRGFAVLQRCDYEVIDETAVLSAGREGYRKAWPDASESEASKDVTHLGRALYHVAHGAGTWDVLRETAGLRATGATTNVVVVETTLGSDPEAWPVDPFDVDDDQVIYSVSDVYLN